MLKLFALLQSRQPIGDRSTCSRPRSRRNDCGVSDYWADLIRLLQIFVETNHRRIEALRAEPAGDGPVPRPLGDRADRIADLCAPPK